MIFTTIFYFFAACQELNDEILADGLTSVITAPPSPSASTQSLSASSITSPSKLPQTSDNMNTSEKEMEKEKEEKEKRAKLIKEHRVGSVTVHECCADYMAKCRHVALGRAKRVEVRGE